MLDKSHIKSLIKNTLKNYNLYSDESFELVYGTIIQESLRGKYRRQQTKLWKYNVHALGICQVEKGTFDWLSQIYVGKFPELAKIQFIDLAYNDEISILLCRLRYLRDPNPIPSNLEGRAKYWKRIYNTTAGKGKPEEFIENYKKYS